MNFNPYENLEGKDPSIIDIILSWRLLRKNIKAYAGISFFALGGAMLSSIIISIITMLILFRVNDTSIVYSDLYINTISFFIIPITLIIIWGFYGAGYGLAYDIMSSGDQFAESSSGFYYFSKFWWQYIILAMIQNFSAFLFIFPIFNYNQLAGIWKFIFYFSLNFSSLLFTSIFFTTYPSLTAQNSLKIAFKENFLILKTHPKRVIKSTILLYGIFYIPIAIFSAYYYAIIDSLMGNLKYILPLIMALATLFAYIIVNPMWNLVATRIYNSYTKTTKGVNLKQLF